MACSWSIVKVLLILLFGSLCDCSLCVWCLYSGWFYFIRPLQLILFAWMLPLSAIWRVSIFAFPFQSRSPRHSQSTQSGLADQAAKLSFASAESLETMSEADVPVGFNRMNRLRQSLPLSRSASQNKLRSPGYWDSLPNHLLDCVRKLNNLKTVSLFILKA